jgi:cytochrome c553
MTYLVEHMSDEYLGEIAQHFAKLDLPYPPAQPAAVAPGALQRGRDLVLQGDGRRGIPACVQCHGERMTGVEPAMPGLVALPHHYLVGQLGGWKTNLRKAAPPDCMADIARRLTDQDIAAVSAWLSSQPAPPNPKPAAQVHLPLPLECGSGLR